MTSPGLSGPSLPQQQPLAAPGICQLSPASGLPSFCALTCDTIPAERDTAGSRVCEPIAKYAGILQAG